jgi:hypothetical protein
MGLIKPISVTVTAQSGTDNYTLTIERLANNHAPK